MVWAHFDTQSDHSNFRFDIRVSKWPNPDTNRLKVEFRMALGQGLPFPRPQRFKLWMDNVPEAPNNRLYPIIDLDAAGEFQLFGTSGVDISGREVEMAIIEHLLPDFPGSDFPGIEYRFKFKQIGFDDYNEQWYWEHESVVHPPTDILMQVSSLTSVNNLIFVHDIPSELNLTWPTNDFVPQFNWEGMSECYTFHPEDLQALSAEFNGADSYIALDHNLVNTNSDFVIEARLRLHAPDDFWPLMGIEGSGGFLGMEGSDFIFGNLRLATSWTPLLNQWFTWRIEFEQPEQLKYRLFIDDVEVMDRTVARQHLQFNRLGVHKHSVPDTTWAHMDMKFLKFLTGAYPSSIVALDMPCAADACDIGPDANHGETFNMELPSC